MPLLPASVVAALREGSCLSGEYTSVDDKRFESDLHKPGFSPNDRDISPEKLITINCEMKRPAPI
jgi:hypothetical protein